MKDLVKTENRVSLLNNPVAESRNRNILENESGFPQVQPQFVWNRLCKAGHARSGISNCQCTRNHRFNARMTQDKTGYRRVEPCASGRIVVLHATVANRIGMPNRGALSIWRTSASSTAISASPPSSSGPSRKRSPFGAPPNPMTLNPTGQDVRLSRYPDHTTRIW